VPDSWCFVQCVLQVVRLSLLSEKGDADGTLMVAVVLQGVTARIRAARVGGEYRHPYDLGLCGNLHEVLGLDASRWCIPDKAAADGSGVSFPTSWVSD